MAEKETLLELRGMNWEENEQFEAFKKEWLESHKELDEKSTEYFYACAAWVMDNVYGADKKLFTPGEVVAIFNATLIHSNGIRKDEIKNWPTSLTGTLNEADIAATAGSSNGNEEKVLTAGTVTTEAQM